MDGGDWCSGGMPGQMVGNYGSIVSGDVGCEGVVSVDLGWRI